MSLRSPCIAWGSTRACAWASAASGAGSSMRIAIPSMDGTVTRTRGYVARMGIRARNITDGDPMITLDESVYVECFWYVNLDTQNYMGMLMRVDGQWFIKYRFREHHDSKVFDSEDKRAWYRITPRKGVPPEQAQ